jgi:perosamine synthetase
VAFIPYGRQKIDDKDIQQVVKALKADFITQGQRVVEFESKVAKYCGAKYAVAVSNGTAALQLACLAAGLKKGLEAVTAPITFLATTNSIVYSGAKPVFVDIEANSFNIDPLQIESKITKKTKALIPVHFAGRPVDMLAVSRLAKKHRLRVIEDAAHAIGARYKNAKGKWIKVGSCQHSDMTTFSFHPVKHITSGEGGMITTNDKALYQKLLSLRNHGIVRDKKMTDKGPWVYEMQNLGYNYRLTDIQSALGVSQLGKLNSFIKRRQQIAKIYDQAFTGLESVAIPEKNVVGHAYHIYVLRIDFKKLKTNRKKVMLKLRKKEIGTQVHYIPIYQHPYYRKNWKFSRKNFPNAEQYYQQCLSIPLYPSMTDAQVKKVIKSIKEVLYG